MLTSNFQGEGHQWKWLDGRLYDNSLPIHSRISIHPLAKLACRAKTKCSATDLEDISSAMIYDQGTCSALLTREGFFDFLTFKTQCNSTHKVGLVCQHEERRNYVLGNNMSDVKISIINGFYSIRVSTSCDVGWFMVDNMCINIYPCSDCINTSVAQRNCIKHGGNLANRIFNSTKASQTDELIRDIKLTLFWGMFHSEEDLHVDFSHKYMRTVDEQMNVAVNVTGLCAHHNLTDLCKDENIIMVITNRYICTYLACNVDDAEKIWSLILPPTFQKASHLEYTLCEKPKLQAEVFTKCSNSYISCKDGTCVHDSLVCDGQPHCLHGEDEADCQHICSDDSVDCMSACHFRNLCSCSSGYFQCLSGGCVPLQKLCDRIVHCLDESDEPPTCVYLTPEQLGQPTLVLEINHYINYVITQNRWIQDECLPNKKERYVNQVAYVMHSNHPVCMPVSHPHDIKIYCDVFSLTSYKHFSLDRLCIYDHDCDDSYENHCFNSFHLLKCENMYCVGRFKCPSSYCISFDHLCNKVCDCPYCEDESICRKLLCPGMVLIELMGTGLKCTSQLETLKLDMNRRQVIFNRGMNITDDFPVLIHLEHVMNITDHILVPELVVYCHISQSDFDEATVRIFQHMVSVSRLELPNNNIQILDDAMFLSMSQLVILDLSYNSIQYFPRILLCSLIRLQFLSLNHNLLSSFQVDAPRYSSNLAVLLLEHNNIDPWRGVVEFSISSLYRLSSDLPRLCCVFKMAAFCSPPFPLLASCSNMISTQVQIVLAWIIGLLTSFLNLFCLLLLIHKRKGSEIIMIFSINLGSTELVTSACLLSYSVINVIFQDIFGIVADQWRQSWECLGLESLFSVSSRASLAFAVSLSVHFAIYIPSMTPREFSQKTTLWQIIMTWILVLVMCIPIQILEHLRNMDPYNYFCLPYATSLLLLRNIIIMFLYCEVH